MWGLHYKSKGRNVGLASIVEIELEMAGVPDGSGMLECQNARGCTAHSLPAVEWESVLRRRIRSSSLAAALDWLTRDNTPRACLTQGLSESCHTLLLAPRPCHFNNYNLSLPGCTL